MGAVFLGLCGIFLGMAYDFFKCLRVNLKYNTPVSVICDLLFWIFATVFVTEALYIRYSLELRFYRICGIFCGVSLYFLLLSPAILKIWNIFFKFFEKILKILFTIIKFCAKIIKKCFSFIFRPFFCVGKFFGKIILKIRLKIFKQIKFMKRKW